jgi:hypothetical protein
LQREVVVADVGVEVADEGVADVAEEEEGDWGVASSQPRKADNVEGLGPNYETDTCLQNLRQKF